MKIGAYEVHPAALEWPALSDADLESLTESIRTVGQREAIKVLDGAIVDGVHRARACIAAGFAPNVEHLPADTDPWEYSATVNGRRRHLESAGKRAAIHLALMEHSAAWRKIREEARARNAASQARPAPKSAMNSGPGKVADAPRQEPAREKLARVAGVSERTAQDVITVHDRDPEAFAQVKSGDLSLEKAAKQVREKAVASPPAPSDVDAIGRVIPEAMREPWKRMTILVRSFDEAFRDLGMDWRKAKESLEHFNESAQSPALERYLLDLEKVVTGPLRQATYAIRSAAPFVVCWKCDGAGCVPCQKTGVYAVGSKENVERELGKKGAA